MSNSSPILSVILDGAIDKPLDYSVPEHLISQVRPGMRVLIPVRGSMRKGTIYAIKDKSPFSKLKPIAELLSEKELLPPDLMQLCSWMSDYYCTPLHKILKIMLPPPVRQGKGEKKQLYVKALCSLNALKDECEALRQKNPLHAQVLDVMLQNPKGILLSQLCEMAKVSRSPITTLVRKKILECQEIAIDRSLFIDHDFFPTKHKNLNPEQQAAFDLISQSLHRGTYQTHLLFGVTGSGKTEIYLQAIEEALLLKKSVIFLVPEIALTSQTVERIKSRFQKKIALLHHRLSAGERLDTWKHILEGTASIVIGARSALFAPVKNLGLIIVDEEHDSSYKQQDEMPCYHARDIAVMRCNLTGATAVLGSATPSLESYQNALNGKYTLSCLKTRPGVSELPQVTIVDMKAEFAKAKGFTLFSEKLLNALEKRIAAGEQSLFFLNRRGYHTSKQCLKCGHVIQCPHCDVSLTFHRGLNQLACHLCDYTLNPPPRQCPECKQEETFKYKGAGTELVEQSLHAIFPELRTLRLDADTTRHKGSHEKLYKQFRAGKADVLIGTQMIVKGLHFPSVTLVGVLNIDATLNIPDFRASETAFQLITQVAGRSGRGELPGEVIIQTTLNTHQTILQAADQNYEAFFQSEIESRRLFTYPPFTHLIKYVFTGTSAEATEGAAKQLRSWLLAHLPNSFQFLPVIPCGHAKIMDNYRFQFIVKSQKISPLSTLTLPPIPKQIKLTIDIDPISTYF